MVVGRRRVPPLNALRTFEAVARNGSFTRAAEELFVTEPAVSRAVKVLEDHFQTQLFDRQPKGLALTAEAKVLLPTVRASLGAIAHVSRELYGDPGVSLSGDVRVVGMMAVRCQNTIAVTVLSALIGESGSGKTTVAPSALGYCKPGLKFAVGEARVAGRDLTRLSNEDLREIRGERVAYLAQSAVATFNPSLCINSQITEAPVHHGVMTRAEADAREPRHRSRTKSRIDSIRAGAAPIAPAVRDVAAASERTAAPELPAACGPCCDAAAPEPGCAFRAAALPGCGVTEAGTAGAISGSPSVTGSGPGSTGSESRVSRSIPQVCSVVPILWSSDASASR